MAATVICSASPAVCPQSALNDKAPAATPYIEWVKEGRKYDLGAMLITQQPGSIPVRLPGGRGE
jgi:hypothetical protein